MSNTVLIINLIVIFFGALYCWLDYKKVEAKDPYALKKLAKKSLCLGLIILVLNFAIHLIDYFKPEEELATKNDIVRLEAILSKLSEPINPNSAEAYSNRGVMWLEKDEIDKAINDFNKAIKLKPNYAIAYNNRGAARGKKGDDKNALDDFNKAINLRGRGVFRNVQPPVTH